jgi:metal-responsive CopG/Arc/MetJ family transcriptional regulator
MSKRDPYILVPFKLPRTLLEQLNSYAKLKCEGNRSLAIRRAIRLLIEEEHNHKVVKEL